jgi:hypothetical protein
VKGTDNFLSYLDDCLVERVFSKLPSEDVTSARDVIALGATCKRLQCAPQVAAICICHILVTRICHKKRSHCLPRNQ